MAARKKWSKEELDDLESQRIPPTPASDKDAGKFLQEIFKLTVIHGPIIGVIQQINLCYVQETTIFFGDGYAFMSELPLIGIDITKEPKYRYNLLCMKKILMLIFGLGDMVEGDYICTRGLKEEMAEARTFGYTCYFIFRPPETGNGVNYAEATGIWTLDQFVQTIAQDDCSEIMAEVGAEK